VDLVEDPRQENKPQTNITVWEMADETGIHRSSVISIRIHKELRLKCFKSYVLTDVAVLNSGVQSCSSLNKASKSMSIIIGMCC